MTDSKEEPHWMPKVDRRFGGDRRQFSYTVYIPERRSGKDRRGKKSTGRTCLLNIEDDGILRAKELSPKNSDTK